MTGLLPVLGAGYPIADRQTCARGSRDARITHRREVLIGRLSTQTKIPSTHATILRVSGKLIKHDLNFELFSVRSIDSWKRAVVGVFNEQEVEFVLA